MGNCSSIFHSYVTLPEGIYINVTYIYIYIYGQVMFLILFGLVRYHLCQFMCCFLPVSPFHPHCAKGLFTAEHDLVAGYLRVAMENMRSGKMAGCFNRSLFSNGKFVPRQSHMNRIVVDDLTMILPGRCPFLLIFSQHAPPHLIAYSSQDLLLDGNVTSQAPEDRILPDSGDV